MAAAAYISREKLHDKYYGLTHDFTHRQDIIHSEIYLPSNAPREFSDRETLWNAVEESEKRQDSRLARGVKLALPVELTHAEQIDLVCKYVTESFVSHGICADVAIHDKGDGNPHSHILLTTRAISQDGFGLKNRDWDKKERLMQWRREWATVLNRELERSGHEERVSHESYAAQGIDREPTIHLGCRVQEYERRGIETDRGRENREIIKRNREREEKQQKRQRERERVRQRSRGRGR